jgi:hypothetical protein
VEIRLPSRYSERGHIAGIQGLGVSGHTKHEGQPWRRPGDSGKIIAGKPAAAHADIHTRPASQVEKSALAKSGRYRPHNLPARAGNRLVFRKPDKFTFRSFYGDI